MKKLISIACCLFSYTTLFAQPEIPLTGKEKSSFIPKGWTIVASVEHDFNKDKQSDLAVVIQSGVEKEQKEYDCNQVFSDMMLLVCLKQADGNYKLSTKSTKIFGRQDCIRFNEIGKRNGTLKLKFTDESVRNIRNDIYYFLRFQNNDWFLIGYQTESTKNTDPDMGVWGIDCNLSAGITEGYRLKIPAGSDVLEGPREVTETIKWKPDPLIKLSSLNVDETIIDDHIPEDRD
jgi:hypothetical protein